jgi:ribose transport system permease protein
MLKAESGKNKSAGKMFVISANRSYWIKSLIPLAGLVFVLLLFIILTQGRLLNTSNLVVITNQAFFTMLAGVGAVFVYAYGGIDLSIGSLQGVCSLVVVLMLRQGFSFTLVFFASIIFGIISGLMCGGSAAFIGIPVFVTSLCMNYILRGIVQTATAKEMMYVPPEFIKVDNWAIKVLFLLVIIAIGYYVFNYTRIGKYMKALGGSQKVAQLSGVMVKKYQIISHMILGGCVGIVGFFAAARAGCVYPASGIGFELDVLIALVLGGLSLSGGHTTRVRCAIIGAMTIAIMSNGFILIGTDPKAIEGIKGIIFIITVILSYERKKGQIIK